MNSQLTCTGSVKQGFYCGLMISWMLCILPMAAGAQKLISGKAEMNEKKYHYRDASNDYMGFYRSGDRDAALRAAANLYKGRMYQEALPLYELADSLRMIDDPEEIFGYFECLKSVKRYHDADALVKTHIVNHSGRREFQLHNDKLEYYGKLESFKGVKLQLLPVNNEFSDISPTIYRDWLYFVSTRPANNNKEIHRINMQPFYNLYAVPLGSDMLQVIRPSGDFGSPEKIITYKNYSAPSLPNGINKRYHDGPIVATQSGKRIFFTTNWSDTKRPKEKRRDFNLLIFYCENENGIWSEPKAVPFNSFDYSNQHGFFDENTQTLYFSSNMPGGHGGYDIWKSTLSGTTWSVPVNLGDKVNTPKTEVFPSITPEGRLVFSSNGWPGLGGLDIFLVQESGTEPLNLMVGINSELDDFGLVFTGPESGYLVSNRSGGKGDDDIYSFNVNLKQVVELMLPPKRVLIANLKDAFTGAPLGGVTINVTNYINRRYVTGPDGTVTDSIAYDQVDPKHPEVVVRFEREGYQTKEIRISEWPEDQQTLDVSLSMERLPEVAATKPNPEKGNEPNGAGKLVEIQMTADQKFIIYFDFDKFNIRKDAAEILAKVAYVLLEEYEAAEVLLSGHTDTRGSLTYNEQLSKNRVNTAKKWLVERGVDPKRIRTDYHGERRLAILCNDILYKESNPDLCLSKEQHQLNRRVEIEILNMIKN